MKGFYLIGFLFLAFGFRSNAQNTNVDSLTKLLNEHPALDEYRAELLNSLAFNYYQNHPQKAIAFADEVLEIKKQKKVSAVSEGTAYIYKGLSCIILSDLATAHANIVKGFSIAAKINNQDMIAICQIGFGNILMYKGNLLEALEKFQLAANYFRRINDKKKLLRIHSNMAAIHSQMKNFDKAIEYFKDVLDGAKKTNDVTLMGVTSLNMGALLCDQGKYSESLPLLHSSVYFLRDENNKIQLARAFGNIGSVYSRIKLWDSAAYYIQKSIELNKELNAQRSIAIQSCNLADVYINTHQAKKAKPLLDDAHKIAVELNIIDLQRTVLEGVSDYYSKMGNADSALYYYKKSVVLKDSILGDVAQKKLTRLSLQYDFDRKADSLRFQNELTAVKLQRQTLFSEQQQQKLLLAEKDGQLQKLLSFQRLAELKTEQKQSEEKTKQLHISINERKLQQAQIASLDKDNHLNKLHLRQQWFFSLGSIILLGALGSFFIYRYNLKQSNLQAEIAKEKAEFETKISNAALNTLRSQMNPHFIFNCLNSIRLFAAKNDNASAQNYISKFSRLMRLVLENSKSERISLQQEIETLQLYVDMELMRFKDKLKYDLHFETGLDTQYIEVPPMIIQPYVENAIWHGLMHKEEGGKLDIDIKEENEILIVKVKDNGVGRAKAAELKNKSATNKSFAMNITKERLELMNEKYGTNASVTVKDLYQNGLPCGTEVTLKIPVL